jgi:transcriptional/translational regulatory protein YebC/TACO1
MKQEGDFFTITCDPASFSKVQEALQANKMTIGSAELTQLPKVPVDTDLEVAKKVVRLVETVDDHDDVQNVYSNLNFTDAVAAELSKSEE